MSKKKPEKKKEEEVAVMDFGVNLGGIFKDVGEFIGQVSKLAEKGAGDIKKTKGMYGLSVSINRKGIPVVRKFGTIQKLKPKMEEVREPLIDVIDEEKQIRIIAELPGIEEEDIKTKVKGDSLTISAKTGDKEYIKKIKLPSKVSGKPRVTYNNGVLEIKIKKQL